MARGNKALADKYGLSESTVRYRLKAGIPLDAPKISAEERVMRGRAAKRAALKGLRIYPTKPVNPFARMVP